MTIVSEGPRRTGSVTADMEIITPDVARQYLTLNISNNRKLKRGRIAGYARDMRNGNWLFTGEAIKFDTDGNLVDGQNRLEGVVLADTPAAFLVVRGVSKEAVALLDSGVARSGADALTIAGVADKSDAKDLAATARVHRGYYMGDMPNAMSNTGGQQQFTKQELIEYLEKNPQLDFAARFARGLYKYLPLPVGAVATAFDSFSKLSIDDTAEFFNRIRDGISTGPGDPFLTLSRRVASDRLEDHGRILPSTALFYLFRTWNAFRADEQLARLQVGSRQSGFTPIPAPK